MVRAADDLVDVCAGGGIRPVHVPDLVRATGVPDIHLSARSASAAGADAATATDPAVVQAAVDAAGEL
jgi:copper homeostasis protein